LVDLASDRPGTGSRDRISVARGIGGAHLEGVWEPLTKPVYLVGDTQALKAAASSLHSKIEFGSHEEKVNFASLCFTVL
jgi:hypothetical protein